MLDYYVTSSSSSTPHQPPSTTTTTTTTPSCTECGRKFCSWKALFGHMRCHPERQWRGIRPPPFEPQKQQPTCPRFTPVEIEVATCLLLLAQGPAPAPVELQNKKKEEGKKKEKEEALLNLRFECSSCKKVFGSHQALGGHRASHKKVKGCSAIARCDNCERVVVEKKREEGLLYNSHSSDVAVVAAASSVRDCLNIDLNFPAPMEEGEEISGCYDFDLALKMEI